MKKIAFSICLTLLFSGFSVAQDAATIAPPAAPSLDMSPVAEVIEAAAAKVARPAEAAAAEEQVETAAVEAPAAALAEVALDQEIVMEQGTVVENVPYSTEGQIIEGQTYDRGQEVYSQAGIYAENQVVGSYGESVVAPATFVAPATSYNQDFVSPTPVAYQAAPVEATSVVSADPFAAPSIVTPAPATNYAPAAACVDCDTNGRRQIFRTITTRGRSVFTRVRGLIGRRR